MSNASFSSTIPQKNFCSPFNLVADILTFVKHASCSSIQVLYFLNIFIHYRYYFPLFVKLKLRCISVQDWSHWLNILVDWHLNKWIKSGLLELHCQPPFRKCVYIVCTRCYNILNCVSRTFLCTTKWLTYNQYKKAY